MRRYSSFLVRWWQAEAGEQRLSIRHVQSDAEVIVAHLADAQPWMAACAADPERAPPPPAPATSAPDPSPPPDPPPV